MILKCCIIDDEPLAIELLESYVKRTPFLQLEASFNSAVQAVERVSHGDIDLIFLDIQMPELDGMEFSRMIEGRSRIIFTTAFGQYAVDSYKVNAIDYLLKPFSYADFLKAAQKALQWFELSEGNTANPAAAPAETSAASPYIFVKSDYKLKQIPLDKILYIEGLKDYVKIYLEGEPHPILSLLSLKSLEEMLPEGQFIRVHRSFIVQGCKIKMIDRNRIVFGKEYIPISDTYKESFAEFIAQHSPLTGKPQN
ncbi:LytR/AlgR family response regulator transcription factor [Barnesiella viscericola]|uniref:LytR/AlgR family response regulator transcription factor n=1 Tax=Barnesiella viscericola TaxID=397865 RepID=UPI0023547423|nr:LytTR family DNA-binding domain-containing protein [Barnesiella viscericola]